MNIIPQTKKPTLALTLDPAIISKLLPFLAHPKGLLKYRLVSKRWDEPIKKQYQLEAKASRRKIINLEKDSSLEFNEQQENLICLLLEQIKPVSNLLLDVAAYKYRNESLRSPQPLLDDFLRSSQEIIQNKGYPPIPRVKYSVNANFSNELRARLLNEEFYLNIPREALDAMEKYFQEFPCTEKTRYKMSSPFFRLATWAQETLKFGKLTLQLTNEAKLVMKGLIPRVSSDDFNTLIKEFHWLNKRKQIWENPELKQRFQQIIKDRQLVALIKSKEIKINLKKLTVKPNPKEQGIKVKAIEAPGKMTSPIVIKIDLRKGAVQKGK